jgi:hypothetical protein
MTFRRKRSNFFYFSFFYFESYAEALEERCESRAVARAAQQVVDLPQPSHSEQLEDQASYLRHHESSKGEARGGIRVEKKWSRMEVRALEEEDEDHKKRKQRKEPKETEEKAKRKRKDLYKRKGLQQLRRHRASVSQSVTVQLLPTKRREFSKKKGTEELVLPLWVGYSFPTRLECDQTQFHD